METDTKVLISRAVAPTHRRPPHATPLVARRNDGAPHVLHFVASAPPIFFTPPAASRAHHPAVSKSAVERAQYAVVQMVRAQTRGLRSLSAITRQQGRDRLLVRVIARTRFGILIESDVLRRNGYGFAIESRKYRAIPAAARIAAAPSAVVGDSGP